MSGGAGEGATVVPPRPSPPSSRRAGGGGAADSRDLTTRPPDPLPRVAAAFSRSAGARREEHGSDNCAMNRNGSVHPTSHGSEWTIHQ